MISKGSNSLANRDEAMKYAIAAIYTNLTSECMNPDVRVPIDTEKGSTVGERHKLLLKFTPC